MTMRILRLGALVTLEALALSEEASPKPGSGEVVVRVRASSLNFHDYLIVAGHLPVAAHRVPMSDGGGEVVECGEGVPASWLGRPVIGTFFPRWTNGAPRAETNEAISGETVDGFAADMVSVPLTSITRMPIGYDFQEAATLPCAAVTAWRALVVEGGLTAGDTVLLMGTGGLAVFAVQLARAMGIDAIVVSSSDKKIERARALGATGAINYRRDPEWGDSVRTLTKGRGVDLVLEVGGASSFAQSTRACRVGGKILLIGTLGNQAPALDVKHLVMNHIRVDGMAVGSRAHQEALVDFIDAHGIRPVIDRTFALEELAGAFRYQLEQRHIGKITLAY